MKHLVAVALLGLLCAPSLAEEWKAADFVSEGCRTGVVVPSPSMLRITHKSGCAVRTAICRPCRGSKEILPILNAKCVYCHTGKKEKPHNLTAAEVLNAGAKRKWIASAPWSP